MATKIVNPGHQEVVVTIDGMPARMLPETCAPPWPKNIPGQIALIGSNQHIIEKQIIFPHSNYGWLHIKNLPAGEYVVYVQFSGKGPVSGLKNVTLSSYGLQTCVESTRLLVQMFKVEGKIVLLKRKMEPYRIQLR